MLASRFETGDNFTQVSVGIWRLAKVTGRAIILELGMVIGAYAVHLCQRTGCLHVGDLEVVAQVRIGVLVVVALGQVAQRNEAEDVSEDTDSVGDAVEG